MKFYFGTFRLLVMHGSDVEHKDHRGATLLFTAAENASDKCLQQILCYNPDLFITVKSSPRTQVYIVVPPSICKQFPIFKGISRGPSGVFLPW